MATEQEHQEPRTIIEFTQFLHKTALDILNGDLKWNEQKKTLIIKMKDTFLDMKKKGFYDKHESEICGDICEVLKIHHADENSFAYVRMCLPAEYKDQTKVTFDSIIKRAFKQNKDEIDKNKINLLEPFKKEDFDGLSVEEKVLFKNEYVDIIKESKRRIRDNRQLVNVVCEDTEINNALVTENTFPDMNPLLRDILLELRTVIKNTKKINRLINYKMDEKGTKKLNIDSDLKSIKEQTARLGGMTNQVISLLN